MTVAQLEALLAIDDHRSFTGAAPALGLTQSAVSRTIAGLERRFGRMLVHRSPSGASLTAAGEEVAVHARVIVERLRAIEGLSAQTEAETIRVGTVASAAVRLVPSAVVNFEQRWPECGVLSVQGNDDELAAWLRNGAVDLIVTATADGSIGSDLFGGIEIEDHFLAVIPSNHRLAKLRTIDLADLASEGVADPGGTCGPRIAEEFDTRGIAWRPDHVVRDTVTVLAMAAAGITSGVIPAVAVPNQLPHGVALRPLNPSVSRSLYIRYRREHRPSVEFARIISESNGRTP